MASGATLHRRPWARADGVAAPGEGGGGGCVWQLQVRAEKGWQLQARTRAERRWQGDRQNRRKESPSSPGLLSLFIFVGSCRWYPGAFRPIPQPVFLIYCRKIVQGTFKFLWSYNFLWFQSIIKNVDYFIY